MDLPFPLFVDAGGGDELGDTRVWSMTSPFFVKEERFAVGGVERPILRPSSFNILASAERGAILSDTDASPPSSSLASVPAAAGFAFLVGAFRLNSVVVAVTVTVVCVVMISSFPLPHVVPGDFTFLLIVVIVCLRSFFFNECSWSFGFVSSSSNSPTPPTPLSESPNFAVI